MILTPEITADIAARASTFDERLANGMFIAHTEQGEREGDVNRRLERWCQMAAKGNREQFERLLVIKGLDERSVRIGLGPVQVADRDRLPEWTGILKQALSAAAASCEGHTGFRFLTADEALPFERIMAPFVDVAVERVRARAGSAYERLSVEAHIALERLLLRWLVNVSSSALMLEFSIFRMRDQQVFGHKLGALMGDASNETYQTYTTRMLSGGLVPFYQEYSVLARAVTRLMTNWIDAVSEFQTRLDRDWNTLRDTFQPEGELGSVATVHAGLSDPHRGGRSVYALSFTSGLKVVYKPKSLETEEAYVRLLNWLNRQGIGLDLKGPRALSQQDYGWTEFIEHVPAATDQERERFYRRSGSLLALLYALESTDVHAENLIAAGEHPILIDAETLITPSLEDAASSERRPWAEVAAMERLISSVLRVGMLPWWKPQANGWSYDLSALGAIGGEAVQAVVWQGVDTDSMSREVVHGIAPRNGNVPFAAADEANPGRYVEHVVDGFCEMYELLLAKREELLSPESPLNDLARAPMRLVFRDTQTYFTILKNSVDAALLRDGADRSVNLEVLSRVALISQSNERFVPFLRAEKNAISEFDIPFFTVSPHSRALDVNCGETIEDCFKESGFERVRNRLRSLSTGDMMLQAGIIRGSFDAKLASRARCESFDEPLPADLAPASENELLEQSAAIGRILESCAVRGSDGSVTWIGLVRPPHRNHYSFTLLTPSLADGIAGVALFLSALHKATGEFRETAMGTFEPVRRSLEAFDESLRTSRKSFVPIMTLGANGLGSIVYAYTRIAQWLGVESALDLALTAARLITPQLIEADESLDVRNGCAGAILGMLSLHSYQPDGRWLETANLCGERIVRCTPSPDDPGIAEALTRLHRVTGDMRFAVRPLDRTTPALPFRNVPDSLEYGIAGFADALVEEARREESPESLQAARSLAAWSITRARKHGCYWLHPNLKPGALIPGFFEGFSGVGYGFLRLARPAEYPSVKLWN